MMMDPAGAFIQNFVLLSCFAAVKTSEGYLISLAHYHIIKLVNQPLAYSL